MNEPIDNSLTETSATAEEWQAALRRAVSPEIGNNLRRRFRRYAVRGEAKLSFTIDDVPHKLSLVILNASVDGLMVKSHEEVPVGTSMHVNVNLQGVRLITNGVVQHCTTTLGGFKLGIKLAIAMPKEEAPKAFGGKRGFGLSTPPPENTR